MRNRAKCKLCNDIIESFSSNDYASCLCGEISVDGGNGEYRASARDFNNFIRVDDEGNEIIVKVIDNDQESKEAREWAKNQITREDLLFALDEMKLSIERLPQHAMLQPITHADFCTLIMLLSAIFRSVE
jgi:hypothetical protein